MAHRIANFFLTIPPVFTDGVLWVCIALFGFLQSYFTSDEAYKYVSPIALFWIKCVVGSLGSCAGAIKMYRSTSYADHVKAKEAARTGNTEFLSKQQVNTQQTLQG